MKITKYIADVTYDGPAPRDLAMMLSQGPASNLHHTSRHPPTTTGSHSVHMAGGRKAKVSAPPAKLTNTLVLDNGAYTLKAGFIVDGVFDAPEVIPNCIARDRTRKIYVASELEKCTDFGEIRFRRPVEKGFIVNWEVQSEIWDYEFFGSKATFPCDPTETRLVLAEPPNGLPVLQSNCDQIVFEEYGFESYYRGVGRLTTMACPTLHD